MSHLYLYLYTCGKEKTILCICVNTFDKSKYLCISGNRYFCFGGKYKNNNNMTY